MVFSRFQRPILNENEEKITNKLMELVASNKHSLIQKRFAEGVWYSELHKQITKSGIHMSRDTFNKTIISLKEKGMIVSHKKYNNNMTYFQPADPLKLEETKYKWLLESLQSNLDKLTIKAKKIKKKKDRMDYVFQSFTVLEDLFTRELIMTLLTNSILYRGNIKLWTNQKYIDLLEDLDKVFLINLRDLFGEKEGNLVYQKIHLFRTDQLLSYHYKLENFLA